VDREVLMLYSSFYRPYGAAILDSYARDALSVGLGVTGGGVQIAGVVQPAFLSWEEFQRDLLIARLRTDDIHIFSLEGCVQQGFLQRMVSLDWDASPLWPDRGLGEVGHVRALLRVALKASVFPWPVIIALLALRGLLGRRRDG
jgi:hypothetical protein